MTSDPRLKLIEHTRQKIEAGAYGSAKLDEIVAGKVVDRLALHDSLDLTGVDRARLLDLRQQAVTQGNARRVSQIDAALNSQDPRPTLPCACDPGDSNQPPAVDPDCADHGFDEEA